MPRTKLDKNNGKFRKLHVLINGSANADGKDVNDIARYLNLSENTVRKYLRSPEKLPFETVCKLAKYLNVPIEELRSCVLY